MTEIPLAGSKGARLPRPASLVLVACPALFLTGVVRMRLTHPASQLLVALNPWMTGSLAGPLGLCPPRSTSPVLVAAMLFLMGLPLAGSKGASLPRPASLVLVATMMVWQERKSLWEMVLVWEMALDAVLLIALVRQLEVQLQVFVGRSRASTPGHPRPVAPSKRDRVMTSLANLPAQPSAKQMLLILSSRRVSRQLQIN